MTIEHGKVVGKKVCDILGLDSSLVTSLQIEITATGLPKLTVEQIMTTDLLTELSEVLHQEFELVQRDEYRMVVPEQHAYDTWVRSSVP